jgi:hypothetical protein
VVNWADPFQTWVSRLIDVSDVADICWFKGKGHAKAKTQIAKFKDAARKLETDNSEKRFN